MTGLGRPVPAGALAGQRQAPSAPVAEAAGRGVALQFATQFPELTDASSWWSIATRTVIPPGQGAENEQPAG
jgi:hypothetical protein